MSQIVKSFLGVFILAIMMVSAGGILSAYMQVLSAQHTHARIVNELENSHYNPEVIRACFEEAKKENCTLRITLYPVDGESYLLENEEMVASDIQGIDEAEVCIQFLYQIPFMAINQEHVISGYAR